MTTDLRRPRTREEFLDLFARYLPRGEQRVQDVKDLLPLTRRGGFRAPEKILIILFPSRAGSNYFGQLLSSTGNFNVIGESFNPAQLAAIKERHKLDDLHDAAQWMIDNRGTPRAFGFKAGFYVLAGAAEIGLLPEIIDRAQLVLLRRRDRVAQAVSAVKGNLSGQMHSRQPLLRPLTEDDYDATLIRNKVEGIRKTEQHLQEFAELLGKDAPLLHYEDICAEPEAHVRRVCDLMGLQMPESYEPKKLSLKVLRDDLSGKWVERFRREHPELG